MYSLKKRNTDPRYVAANFNGNTQLNQARHCDQLVQHHQVGSDADRHLLSEKGNAYSLINDKLKAANLHYISKAGTNKQAEEYKSKIER